MAFMKKNPEKMGAVTAQEIREKYNRSNTALQHEQWSYVINRAMLHGDQWLNYDRVRSTIHAIPREPDRVRVTVNRLWPASRHLMSKLLSRPLVFEVTPSQADDACIVGSHVAEAVLEDLMRKHNWEESRELTAWNTWLGGTAGLSLDWDQTYGTKIGEREDGSKIGTGDLSETALSILEMAWDPGARDVEHSYWWIRAVALPPDTVKKMYGLKDLPAADAAGAQGYLGRNVTIETIGRPRPELTLVLTYYERPCEERPDGAVAVVINDKIVDGPHKWPFPFKDRLNLTIFRETKLTSKGHGDTVFSSAVPVQVAFNQSWSNIIEHLKLAGNARLIIPDAALDGIEDLTDLPGEILNYNSAGGKPEWMTPTSLPNWVLENSDRLAREMDDILGLHEISRGVAPSGIESGVGLSVLVEQDTTPLGALTREMAYGFERFATMALQCYADKVKETRVAKVKYRGATPEIVQWTGKDLAGQTEATVPMDAVMPRSRTALMAFAKEMWDRGIIKDPQHFTRIADLPDQDDLIAALEPDVAKAQRENRDMAVGQIRVPREFDNHAAHIEQHNKFRKTVRYESMTEDMQELVDLHIQAHETEAAGEAGKQTQRAAVSPALSAVPTAEEAAPLPEGMVPQAVAPQPVPPGGGGAPIPGLEPQVPSGREGTPPEAAEVLAPGPEGPIPS